jgi:hypothetical protein
MKNLTFWMELNTLVKILVFCVSSFQSSWHFIFCISWETKHSLRKKTQLVAAPVAARGVLFGNAHVTPSRYLLDRQHYFS